MRELRDCIHRAVLLKEGSQAITVNEILSCPEPRPAEEEPTHRAGANEDVPFRDLSKQQKKATVRMAIAKYGSARMAAEKLGVSHQTIYNYLEDPAGRAG